MTERNLYFDTVLRHNKDYIDAVNSGARAEVQESLLRQSEIVFRTMILEAGLAIEYGEYCDKLNFHNRLFDF